MKSELEATVEPSPDGKKRRGKRRSAQGPASRATMRFFLSKSENNGVPVLDREFANEPEVMIESLKTGKSYFVVSEWKGLADLSKKIPLIRKEVVTNKKHNLE